MFMCHRVVESPLCRCVWKPACCLHVVLVSVFGSGTIRWTGNLYLTPCAKIHFASWLFLLSSLASSLFLVRSAHVFLFHVIVCLHSRLMAPGRCSRRQGRSLVLFVLSFPFFFPSLKGRLSGMLGVSKLASVSGVPGEQPCRNSWAEWAVRRKGGKVSSVPWGFPNPNAPCKDLLWTTFGQPVFTPAYKPSSVGWRTHF